MEAADPLFTLSCLPPAAHVRLMQHYPSITFDNGLHFRKQTLRNRYHILSPNGVQTMVIPTVHTGGKAQPLGEVRISYADIWHIRHWRSLEAAYRRSPLFEFYENDLRPIFEHRYELLTDFNAALLRWLLDATGIKTELNFLTATPGPENQGSNDFRYLSETGDPLPDPEQAPYLQVFSKKTGFVGGLSAIDGLFNGSKSS
jgi:hypothetical protein